MAVWIGYCVVQPNRPYVYTKFVFLMQYIPRIEQNWMKIKIYFVWSNKNKKNMGKMKWIVPLLRCFAFNSEHDENEQKLHLALFIVIFP